MLFAPNNPPRSSNMLPPKSRLAETAAQCSKDHRGDGEDAPQQGEVHLAVGANGLADFFLARLREPGRDSWYAPGWGFGLVWGLEKISGS